ncbi:segregation and condensation protein B [Frigoribacterium sp. PhB160]|uniref:SMC-Scp complex subunit ScpB n=1 Tax=Frigoribacterium sp. PhB160 TaxID=2485192 RepID=UPI000F4931DF|nr:SMC-Scp complex subunit ScpB [Frigoribacterium sp. PhB160]ROS62669.1 segregation and condensation protein B [Frigoribacterium sp. PhB160]
MRAEPTRASPGSESGARDAPRSLDAADPLDRADPSDASAPSIARRLEALLMVADEPQSLVDLAAGVGAPVAAVRQAVESLVADFDGVDGTLRRGFELREVGGGWRFYVRDEHDPLVRDFVLTQNPSRLSQAALETLAVIAYKQPITRSSIAQIRAVNVDSVVRTLLGRGLVTESSTDPETGAITYETTDLLLTHLGINSLDELPLISPLLSDGSGGFDDAR